MGHSLTQFGNSVIGFAGCHFKDACFSDLVIQKPKILGTLTQLDCLNGGVALSKEVNGLTVQYCHCIDLPVAGLENVFYTGPQCQFTHEHTQADTVAASPVTTTTGNDDIFLAFSQSQDASTTTAETTPTETAEPTETVEMAEALPDDGTCGSSGCYGLGICSNAVCFCDGYHSGAHCEIDIAHPGIKNGLAYMFFGVAAFLGLVTGYFIAKIYNENNKRLFKR